MSDTAPTLIACLTPPGKGAIATLAVRGPAAWDITRSLFRPLRAKVTLPEQPPAGKFWFGQLGEDARDEVVLAVQRAGPEPWLELHCHGGIEVVRLLVALYVRRGAWVCSWRVLDSYTGGLPAWQVAAQEWLVQAPTTRTAAILLDQYHGAFHQAVTEILAHLEASRVEEAKAGLAALLRYDGLGRHLLRPWKVVLAGAPNVGKSSLVNALAGFTRSVVSPIAGTTRDVLTVALALDGWPVELTDTAGFHAAPGALEREGMARARAALDQADVRLWLLDGSAPPVLPDDPSAGWQLVISKVDLAPAWDWARFPTALRVSAETRAGLAELCQVLTISLVPHVPAPGEAVPFAPDVCDRISRALVAVQVDRLAEAREALHGL
jgi:tRNA modification GTPase